MEGRGVGKKGRGGRPFQIRGGRDCERGTDGKSHSQIILERMTEEDERVYFENMGGR